MVPSGCLGQPASLPPYLPTDTGGGQRPVGSGREGVSLGTPPFHLLAMRPADLYADCPACHGQGEVWGRDFAPGLVSANTLSSHPRSSAADAEAKASS